MKPIVAGGRQIYIGRIPSVAASVAALTAVGMVLAGCSSDDESGDRSGASATVASTPTADPSRYLIANREQFLATDPTCEELTTWYEKNPTDYDVPTAARFVEKCNAVPAGVVTKGEIIEQLIDTVYAADVPETDPGLQSVRAFLAVMACSTFADGTLNPIDVANDVEGVHGGDAVETRRVLEIAANTCSEYKDELLLFTVPDIRGAGDKFTAFVARRWPDATGSPEEYLALAAMACAGQLDDDLGASLVATITGEGNEDQLIREARKNLCP